LASFTGGGRGYLTVKAVQGILSTGDGTGGGDANRIGKKALGRILDQLVAEGLVESGYSPASEAIGYRVSAAGLAAFSCGRVETPVWTPAGSSAELHYQNGEQPKRYKHLRDVPKDQLEDDLNKAALSGYRVVNVSGHYADRDSREVLYWAVLELPPAVT
jgi:hypothetical protein